MICDLYRSAVFRNIDRARNRCQPLGRFGAVKERSAMELRAGERQLCKCRVCEDRAPKIAWPCCRAFTPYREQSVLNTPVEDRLRPSGASPFPPE